MIILGVNGWYERSHDASACIVLDGQLIAAVEEERLSRRRHAYDTMPTQSVAWCLDHCGITVNDIDAVAVGWDVPRLYEIHERQAPFQNEHEYLGILLPKGYFGVRKRDIPVHFIEHHLAHAASTFYLSGFDSSLVLIMDGQGEDVSTTMWQGSQGSLHKIASFSVSLSLGYLFEAASSFIGLATTHAGKTTGLAAYGTLPDQELLRLTKRGYELVEPFQPHSDSRKLDEQSQMLGYWNKRFTELFGEPNPRRYGFSRRQGTLSPDPLIGSREQAIAALVQREVERVVLHLTEAFTRQAGLNNLCLAGGVALNCVCNGRIALSGLVDDLFIQPAAHDTGVAIGAALEAARTYGELKSPQKMTRADLGPSYSDDEIVTLLRDIGIQFSLPKDISQEAAQLIAEGKVLGWFQGGCEIGPRALGSRSILADPRTHAMRDNVNRIKEREPWRPLSPSILAERSSWLLGKHYDSPFMLEGLPVVENRRNEVAGITHVDGTTRPQTVTIELERYYRMLVAFESITGIPLVLNTSFNGAEEPIVCTPRHAIRCFFDMPLDVLLIGNCVIRKE